MKRNSSRQTIKTQPSGIAQPSAYVKPREVAALFGCSEAHIRILMQRAKLPAIRLGGRWFMHRKDFERLERGEAA
jgi:hypothetical protein